MDADSLSNGRRRNQCEAFDSVRSSRRTAMLRILAVDDDPHIGQAVEMTMAGGTVPIFQTFVGCSNRTAEIEREQEEDPRAS
jgi:hypothetical protein